MKHRYQDKVSKDFINGFIKIKKVIELNGYHWHSQRFNGRTKKEYEKNMVNDFKSINVDCLVIWDNELNTLNNVKRRINDFIYRRL